MQLKNIVLAFLALAASGEVPLAEMPYIMTKKIFSQQRAPVPEEMLDGYVQLFLNMNPMAKDYLPKATLSVLNHWAQLLAQGVERKYKYSTASTTTNRLEEYHAKILALLQKYQSELQKKVFQSPIDVTEGNASPSVSLPMQLLLSSYEQREKEFQGVMASIDQKLQKWDQSDDAQKNALNYEILKDIEQANQYRNQSLESFVGLPSVELLNLLDKEGQILRQESHMTLEHMGRLVNHCKMLHAINSTVVQRLVSVFLYMPELQPCDDHEANLKKFMINELIEKIGKIRLKLSEKNKKVFDHLCRMTTLTLWNQWVHILQNRHSKQSGHASIPDPNQMVVIGQIYDSIKANWEEVMSEQECSALQLHQWFSAHRDGAAVPNVLLTKWYQELLDLYNVVQNEGLLPRFYASVAEQLPDLIQAVSKKLAERFQQSLSSVTEAAGAKSRPDLENMDSDPSEPVGKKSSKSTAAL